MLFHEDIFVSVWVFFTALENEIWGETANLSSGSEFGFRPLFQFKQYLFPNKYLHISTHIDTNTWKMDWKTSYLKLI